MKEKLDTLEEKSTVWKENRKVIINWSALVGTLIVIAAIVTAVWKLKRHRKKSINSVLSSMQQPKQEMLHSVLYPV